MKEDKDLIEEIEEEIEEEIKEEIIEEIKEETIEETIEENFFNKSILIKSGLGVLAFALIILVITITYLQFSTFERVQISKSVAEYYKSIEDQLTYTEEGLVLLVPEEVVGTEMTKEVQRVLVGTQYELENLYYEGESQIVEMNLTYLGFYIPLACKINFIHEGESIRPSYENITIGKNRKDILPMFNGWAKNTIGTKILDKMQFTPDKYISYKGVSLLEVTPEVENLKLVFQVDTSIVQDIMEQMKLAVNAELIIEAENSENNNTRLAVTLLQQEAILSKEQIEALAIDLGGNKKLVEKLLVLIDEDATKILVDKLSEYGVEFSVEKIKQDRKVLKGEKINESAVLLLNTLENHFEDKFIAYNQGKPFDIESFTTITVNKLIDMYTLEIEDELTDKLYFVLNDGVGVSYQIDEETYYIKYLDNYDIVPMDIYNNIKGAGPEKEVAYVDTLDEWTEIMAPVKEFLGVEIVYVRYMKSDSKSAFVIVSPEDDSQEYWSIALYKEEAFKILESNVQDRMALLSDFPLFNIDTVLAEIETVKLKRISDSIYKTIIEEMRQLGKLSYSKKYTILYSSYDGKYISFLLSNGEEYVYKVEGTTFGTYLTTVYTKVKALKNWPDLPEIIVLQDKPEI